jgi:hypothetical protein
MKEKLLEEIKNFNVIEFAIKAVLGCLLIKIDLLYLHILT